MGTPVSESLESILKVDTELVGERSRPSNEVAQFMHLLFDRAFPDCLGELAELFGEPGKGGGDTSSGIHLPICAVHDILEGADLHGLLATRSSPSNMTPRSLFDHL